MNNHKEESSMKPTNMDELRKVTAAFIYQPFEPDMIHNGTVMTISHPFINTPIGLVPVDDSVEEEGKVYVGSPDSDFGRREAVNLLEEYGENRYREFLMGLVKNFDTPINFFTMLQRPYRFTFLRYVHKYLSDDDLGECLGFAWTSSGKANLESVISKKQLVRLFRRSTKETLMDEEELAVFKELPELVTVYHGVTDEDADDLKVFSWKLSIEAVEEEDHEGIYQAELPKDGVLAYFSDEQEIVVDPDKLENIQQVD